MCHTLSLQIILKYPELLMYLSRACTKTPNFFFLLDGGSNETLKTMSYNTGHGNSVALAAVRDLQTQQSLRMGAPLPTKSVLLIRAVQMIDSGSKLNKTPELVTPTYCDEEKTPEVEERFLATSTNEEKFSRTASEAAVAASPSTASQIGNVNAHS